MSTTMRTLLMVEDDDTFRKRLGAVDYPANLAAADEIVDALMSPTGV